MFIRGLKPVLIMVASHNQSIPKWAFSRVSPMDARIIREVI